ncbi:MAG TPA: TolC family protein [Fimbriimonadaceae bacterium]|nr:TolC family protein [Fimbriimonadaceae bacterium]
MSRLLRLPNVVIGLLLVSGIQAQERTGDRLTLAEAVQLARQRNGEVQAAVFDVQAARARVNQARSAFFPTVTPAFRYDDQRRDIRTGPSRGAFVNSTSQADIVANWRVLDSGERMLSLMGSRSSFQAQEFIATQTLRNTLFSVHQQYFDTLRSHELQRVADLQVQRAEEILKQTIELERVGEGPRKDILQARADALNARVQQLQVRNRTVSNEAALKATIGWEANTQLPPLEPFPEPARFDIPESLEQITTEGLARRADLQAQRFRAESQGFTVRRAEREAGLTWSVETSYQAAFSRDVFQNRGVSFLVSFPLFDAGRVREAVRESRFTLEATRSALVQSERNARSEIEAAYLTLSQDAQRVNAARLAVDAARENYEAAVAAFRAGALGTNVVTVLTAQVSLVTAESNYIEAVYDYYISEARLRLATGQPVLGESP